MSDRPTVAVAMSGGVDSSVTAALLVERGYRVIGLMLRLWNEPGTEADNRCCTPDAMALARRVAARLEIPFYALDVQDTFRSTVVQAFIDGHAQGITPNPCLVCNRHIRWGFLLDRALVMGADCLATGHYARVRTAEDGRVKLLRGMDAAKDQSYVLSILNQEQLARTLYPVGEFSKPEVRDLARKYDLPVASRADSQDLCFLGKGDYRTFLARNAPQLAQSGPIVSPAGELLGQHEGLANYTIGQRKGLGLSSPAPMYVIGKDVGHNILVVGPEDALGQRALEAGGINWISGEPPAGAMRVQVKIRYKATEVWGTVLPRSSDRVRVEFDQPLRDITPGQRVVFYQDEVCLGGGAIQTAGG